MCSLLVLFALVHGEAGHEKAEQEVDVSGHGLDRESREATDAITNEDASASEIKEEIEIERQRRSCMCRLLCRRICRLLPFSIISTVLSF